MGKPESLTEPTSPSLHAAPPPYALESEHKGEPSSSSQPTYGYPDAEIQPQFPRPQSEAFTSDLATRTQSQAFASEYTPRPRSQAFTSEYTPRPQSQTFFSESEFTSGPNQKSIQVNHLYIKTPHAPIRGSWTVDPNFYVAPEFIPKLRKRDKLHNVHVKAHKEEIAMNLLLVSETPTTSLLHVGSRKGSVVVNIVARVNQRFNLTVKNRKAPITVFIPTDFHGMVHYQNPKGTTTFSEAILESMTPLGSQPKKKKMDRAFIGDLANSQNADKFEGDELTLISKTGKIKVYYYERWSRYLPRRKASLGAFSGRLDGRTREVNSFSWTCNVSAFSSGDDVGEKKS